MTRLATAVWVASLVMAAMIVANMKTYRIFFWHGRSEALATELSVFCTTDDNGDLFYTGSLDDFLTQYGRHFIVKPQHDIDSDYDDLICVTQYSSWGQR